MNKLKIINYFDDLVSKIDRFVELYTADNQHNQAIVDATNKARREWLKEIDACLRFNISQCRENEEGKPPIEDSELFKCFCFLIELMGDVLTSGRFTWRLVSTDMYLRPGQIEIFQEVLKFTNIDHNMEYILELLAGKYEPEPGYRERPKPPCWEYMHELLSIMRRFFPNIKVGVQNF
jgi:hypothetical protein